MLTAHNSRMCFAAPCQQDNIYFFCVRKKIPNILFVSSSQPLPAARPVPSCLGWSANTGRLDELVILVEFHMKLWSSCTAYTCRQIEDKIGTL